MVRKGTLLFSVGRRRWLAAAAVALAGVATLMSLQSSATAANAAGSSLPPIRHVFVVLLENEDAPVTFGASSAAPYLARTLTARGALVPKYYGVTHYSLGNYLALISDHLGVPIVLVGVGPGRDEVIWTGTPEPRLAAA